MKNYCMRWSFSQMKPHIVPLHYYTTFRIQVFSGIHANLDHKKRQTFDVI